MLDLNSLTPINPSLRPLTQDGIKTTPSANDKRVENAALKQLSVPAAAGSPPRASSIPHPQETFKTDHAANMIKPSFKEALSQKVLPIVKEALAPSQNRTIASLGEHKVVYSKEAKNLPTLTIEGRVYTFSTEKALGRGGFKLVFKEANPNPHAAQMVFAKSIKTLANMSDSEKTNFLNEVNIQASLKGRPEFLQLEHAIVYQGKKGEKIGLMMELCDQESVSVYNNAKGQMERMEQLPAVFLDVLNGLSYLEEAGIQHRDIKSANIFLATDPNDPPKVRGKIADFGYAVKLNERVEDDGKVAGTIDHMSPSYMRGKSLIEEAKDFQNAGKALLQQAGNTKNPELASTMRAEGNKLIQKSRDLTEKGSRLTLNTKNDLWAAGIVLNEIHSNYPACIPLLDKDPVDNHLILAENYDIKPWLPMLQNNANAELKRKLENNRVLISAAKLELTNPDLGAKRTRELNEKIRALSDENEDYSDVLENGVAAEFLLQDTNDGFNFYATWMRLLPQEALDAVQHLQMEAASFDDEKKTIAFNFRMLRVDVDSQPSAKELSAAFKAMKEEVDEHNSNPNRVGPERSIFWLQA